jgi:hypothetical protein
MKSIIVMLSALFISTALSQQDTTKQAPKPPDWGWKHRVVAGLTLTQVAFKDWTQGGENAVAYSASLEGNSTLDQENYLWVNNYKFAFGQTQMGEQGVRKTDDKIDLESVLSYKMNVFINPFVSATLKTQFAPGFKYDNGEYQVSKFFDPAYLTQAIGVGYQPIPELKTRLGAALREVFADRYASLYSDDPKTSDKIEKSKVEGGLESVTEVDWKVEENVLFTTKLELFAAFKSMDVVIMRSDSKIAAKVSKYVSVIFNVQFINDATVSPRTQVKEIIGLGLSYQLL